MAISTTTNMTSDSKTKVTTKRLPCKLTQDEIMVAGKNHARAYHDFEQANEAKKEAAAEHTSIVKSHQMSMGKYAEMVSTGVEYRDTDVEEYYDFALGLVRITRTDTGEVLETRPLTASEKQLRMSI